MRMARFLLPSVLLLASCTGRVPGDERGSPRPEQDGTVYLQWQFGDSVRFRDDEPWRDAYLVLSGSHEREAYFGDFLGCAGDPWVVPEGSLSTVQCWFAGSGDELSVFRTADDELTIRHRFIVEPDPEVENPELYGDFQDIAVLAIPADSLTEVLPMAERLEE